MTRTPHAFARRDLVPLVARLPLARWQRFRAWQADIRRNDRVTGDELYAIRRGLQIARRMLPAGTPDDIATSYRAELVEEIGTWRRINGESPDDATIRGMIERRLPADMPGTRIAPANEAQGLAELLDTLERVQRILAGVGHGNNWVPDPLDLSPKIIGPLLRFLIELLKRTPRPKGPPKQPVPPQVPAPSPAPQPKPGAPRTPPQGGGAHPVEQILKPGGRLVGRRGSRRGVRMVTRAEFNSIEAQLHALSGRPGVYDARYGGHWFTLPGGRFGIRTSKRFGRTIDVDHPLLPRGFKIHIQ
jgi:hypothetical protein